MNKKLATLGLAAGLSVSPLASSAQKTSIQEDVSKHLTEIMDDEAKIQKNDLINFLDAQKEIKLRKQIQELLEGELADNEGIKKLKEKYGEAFVLDQMTSIISLIAKNADYYGTFNKDGDYVPNEERVQMLLEDLFPDISKLSTYGLVLGAALGIIGFLMGISINKWINKKNNHGKRDN